MKKIITKIKYKPSVVAKLYFDIFHKSSLGLILTLLMVFLPENNKVYMYSNIIAIYAIILIFSDFGINQLLYQAFAKLISTKTYLSMRKICMLYIFKISLNSIFIVCAGLFLVSLNIFDIELIISMSIWLFCYQLTAQPLISAIKKFSLLSKAAFYSQFVTLSILIVVFLLSYKWDNIFIYYPAVSSLSVCLISWILTLNNLINEKYSLRFILNNISISGFIRIAIKSIRDLKFLLNGSLIWSNTVATVFLYQIQIIILSSYASDASTNDLSYGVSYLNFPLVFLRLNSIVLTLGQYLLQYKVSDYAKTEFLLPSDICQYMRNDLSAFRKYLMNLILPLLLGYLLLCFFLYLKYTQSPFLLINLILLLFLSPIIIFFRLNRIFLNKMIVSFGSAVYPIYSYNLLSILLTLILFGIITSYDYIFSQHLFVYLIIVLGTLLDCSFYTFSMINLARATNA